MAAAVPNDSLLVGQLKRNESHLDAAPSAAKPSVGEFSGDALKEVESRAAVLGLCASLAHVSIWFPVPCGVQVSDAAPSYHCCFLEQSDTPIRTSVLQFLLSLLNDKSLPRLSVANPKGHVIALLFGDVQVRPK